MLRETTETFMCVCGLIVSSTLLEIEAKWFLFLVAMDGLNIKHTLD